MNLYDALKEAYQYATDNSPKSDFAKNAKALIEAMLKNRHFAAEIETSLEEADYVQLLYIVENLQYWRGDKAIEAKIVLRSTIKDLEKHVPHLPK